MRSFHKKALHYCGLVDKEVIVNVYLHGMAEEYIILWESLSFLCFFQVDGSSEPMNDFEDQCGRQAQLHPYQTNAKKKDSRDPQQQWRGHAFQLKEADLRRKEAKKYPGLLIFPTAKEGHNSSRPVGERPSHPSFMCGSFPFHSIQNGWLLPLTMEKGAPSGTTYSLQATIGWESQSRWDIALGVWRGELVNHPSRSTQTGAKPTLWWPPTRKQEPRKWYLRASHIQTEWLEW